MHDLSVQVYSAAGMAEVVRSLDLCVRRGQTFALVGESGCGKSMTALALMRLLPEAGRVAAGQAWLEGLELNALPESRMRTVRGGRIGMVFQEPSTSLNPVLTIGRQLLEVLHAHTEVRGAAAREQAVRWLARVGIAEPQRRLDDYPFQFSGGQKQRIMIAMALAARPALLIADEPTTALDVTVQAQILDLLAQMQREMGMAMLLITHDLAVVRNVAHYVALMRHGQIVEAREAQQFFADPRHPYARELLAAMPSYAKRGRRLSAQAPDEPASATPGLRPAATGQGEVQADAVASVVGAARERLRSATPGSTEVQTPAASAAPAAGAGMAVGREVVLRVHGLGVRYRRRGGLLRRADPGHVAAEDVSFELRAGQTLALLGASGCGKTTVAKALLRLLDGQAQVQGQAELVGETLLDARGARLKGLRRRLQIVFQDPYASLDPRMQVGDILQEGMAALRPGLSAADRAAIAGGLLNRVGLPVGAAQRYPHEFSGGQRQRLAIARALAVEPRVLVCDEPTSALDVSVQAQILDLLQELQRERGIAYLFITHNFGVVEYLADQIAVMHAGRIVEQGEAAQVLLHPAHEATRNLLRAVPRL
ncbi:ABC transporter ATP-binding protein [Candidimonas nitroreducens]|uniref:ABC transporter ATP-binding protein n=1 Tax=Candidimonas nitroreducens TaxID=683354 RepID=UPI0022B93E32|nr:dipeptide ABC transporter ATP-binding protein [Candidimonas nitroreducens]